MKVQIEPTPELFNAMINDTTVPVRIWRGVSRGGVEVECYVLAITPMHEKDTERLQAEFPPFMVRARNLFKIADWPRDTSGDQ